MRKRVNYTKKMFVASARNLILIFSGKFDIVKWQKRAEDKIQNKFLKLQKFVKILGGFSKTNANLGL